VNSSGGVPRNSRSLRLELGDRTADAADDEADVSRYGWAVLALYFWGILKDAYAESSAAAE